MLSVKPWKLEAVLQLLLAILACSMLGMLPLSIWYPKDAWETPDGRFLSFVVGSLLLHGMGIVFVSVFLRQHQVGWAAAFGFRSPRLGRALLIALVTALVIIPLTWELGNLSSKVMEYIAHATKSAAFKPQIQVTVQTLQTSVSIWQRVYFGVFTIGIAPVVEETLFRGIIYPAVKQLGFPQVALWGTSIFFALIHANAMSFVPLTVFAVVLAMLYDYTDNLLAPILAHALFNAVNFIQVIASPQGGL
jgi:membrane protease YdiL (CAAX protease family)